MRFTRIRTAPRDDLLRFLNRNDFTGYKPDVAAAGRTLRECVEVALQHKTAIRNLRRTETSARELKTAEWTLSRQLYARVWTERLEKIIRSADSLYIQPHSVINEAWDRARRRRATGGQWFDVLLDNFRSSERDEAELVYSDVEDLDLLEVFQKGPLLIVASPHYINHVLAFLDLLTDPEVGIARLFRCEQCRAVGVGRPDQRFCSGKCRSAFHNKQRDPKINLRAVGRYRQDLAVGIGLRQQKSKNKR